MFGQLLITTVMETDIAQITMNVSEEQDELIEWSKFMNRMPKYLKNFFYLYSPGNGFKKQIK